jgi:hypothetical protein
MRQARKSVKLGYIRAHAPLWYTLASGGFLLLQGTSTLLFRLVPALDTAFPALLGTTHMIPIHSTLHIVTGLLALALVGWGGAGYAWWFALGFGTFYTLLGLAGLISGQQLGLGLQPFDHPFHLLAGLPGLVAAALWYRHPA